MSDIQKPIRIQLSRKKGWRLPEGAVNVARPSKWGNPFKVGEIDPVTGEPMTAQDCVRLFCIYQIKTDYRKASQSELRGKSLACWCPLDQPCHADILLEIANVPLVKKESHG